MNTMEFWQLIEAARADHPDDQLLRRKFIQENFLEKSDADLRDFHETLCEHLAMCNTWDFVNAMAAMQGFVSDDAFLYWRGGLILQGKKVFDLAIENVDNLALFPNFATDELFLYLARDEFQSRHKGARPSWTPLDEDIEGENPLASAADYFRRYPRLCEKYDPEVTDV